MSDAAAKPAVSVIMNCLNCLRDLKEALDSVCAQTFQDWEIIFWNNASHDGSLELVKEYSVKLGHKKIRHFTAEKTIPLGAARNLALSKAEGEFIAFLDCDDIWLPEKLEKQMELMSSNNRLGLVCTDTEVFSAQGGSRLLFKHAPPQRGMVFKELMIIQWISMSSALVRREALDKLEYWFDERLNVCEEADLFYRIAHNWELDYVNAPLTRWRVHGSNTTFLKFGQFAEETRYILEKHKRIYPGYETEYADLVSLLTRRSAFQEAVALWRKGKNSQARSVLAPYKDYSLKYRLFNLATRLPGGLFDLAAKMYFALPARIRRIL